jgi:hypothetical protein
VTAARGGLVDTERGITIEDGIVLVVPISVEVSHHDHWIVDDKLYAALGGPIDRDAATQTIVAVRSKGSRLREPRTSSRAR